MWNDDNAIYDDGEWITWTEINSHLARLEFEAEFPHYDVQLIPILQTLIRTAIEYNNITGKHLHIYGDIGEIYGAITHGLKLHRDYAQGSDGKIGNDFVEVKTITPFKNSDTVTINLERHFSKILLVKIDNNFDISSKLIDRKKIPKSNGKNLRISWQQFDQPFIRSQCV